MYPYPRTRRQRHGVTLGRLGAAPTSLPTQPGSGSGWIAVVIDTVPNAVVNWQQTGGSNAAMMLVVQPPIGGLQEPALGTQGPTNYPYVGSGQTFTFYLLPTDAAGNAYAPVESVVVKGAPGIYASPSVPADQMAALKAAHPGLQVYGTATQQQQAAPPAPWYEAAGDVSIAGYNIPVIGLAIVAAGAIFGPKLLGRG